MAQNIVSTPTHERCVTSYAARTQYKPGVVHPPHIKVKDAIDIHCHTHEGQQDPYDLARRASLAFIVDDESNALDVLESYIARIEFLKLVGRCADAEDRRHRGLH